MRDDDKVFEKGEERGGGRVGGLSREIQVAVEKSAEEERSLEGSTQLRLRCGKGGQSERRESHGGRHFGCLDSALVLALLERAAYAAALHSECSLATTASEIIYGHKYY